MIAISCHFHIMCIFLFKFCFLKGEMAPGHFVYKKKEEEKAPICKLSL